MNSFIHITGECKDLHMQSVLKVWTDLITRTLRVMGKNFEYKSYSKSKEKSCGDLNRDLKGYFKRLLNGKENWWKLALDKF